jgi:AraC-like DNA-binding protein
LRALDPSCPVQWYLASPRRNTGWTTLDRTPPAPTDKPLQEPVKAWRFTTRDVPAAERQAAWRLVMERLRLPLGEVVEADGFEGGVVCLSSPLGMDFALMEATPQAISGRNPNQPAAVWLVVLLEGEAAFRDAGELDTRLQPGDIVYGPTGTHAALTLSTRFRLLFINAPRVALDHRLLAPQSLRVGLFQGGRGLGHVFSGLLRATAETLTELTSEQLRPVELAVTEFLLANLAAQASPASVGGAEAARAAHLHRVCQTIETLLADPGLSLEQAAAADGVSPRALQKLFASAGRNFTAYVRDRRLERCRLDLSSPICASLSISEICFRWGFNGSAHFSRAFRARYGVSPRDYRKATLGEAAKD